jgi:hypothetical protein
MMKKLFKNKHFRNLLHVVVGGLLGYLLSLAFDNIQLLVQLFLTVFVVGSLGIMWEWFWKMYNHSEIDYWDVIRAIIPALFFVHWSAGIGFTISALIYYFYSKKK